MLSRTREVYRVAAAFGISRETLRKDLARFNRRQSFYGCFQSRKQRLRFTDRERNQSRIGSGPTHYMRWGTL